MKNTRTQSSTRFHLHIVAERVGLRRHQTWLWQKYCQIRQRLGESHKKTCLLNKGQPLRLVETDEWALTLKAKPIPETPAERQRDIHELTHLPPVPWYQACVSGKAADDPRRRRQDAIVSGLEVASFDHCDISAKVGMFNKKLEVQGFGQSHKWSSGDIGRAGRRHRTHVPIHL